MKPWKSISGCAALITLMGSTAALADVTAQEVWADWNSYLTGFGYQISAQQNTSGDTLTVTDFTATTTLPEDGGSVTLTLASLEFTDRGDGTVAVSMAQHNPVIMDITPKDGKPVHMELDYFQTGLSMIVSGTADEMTYASTASEMGIELKDLTVDGTKADAVSALLTGRDFLGNYVSRVGNLRSMESNSSFGSVEYKISVADPEGKGSFDISGMLEDLKTTAAGAFPMAMDFQDLGSALKAGFSANGNVTYGQGSSDFSANDNGKITSGSSSSTGGSLEFALDENHLMYGATNQNAEMTFSSPDIPFPSLTIKMAETVAKLMLPVSKSDTPQDFGFTIKLVDFALPEEVWSIADPTGTLPHDPATVILDLAGKAKLFFDILDPKAQEEMQGQAPGEVDELKLNALEVKVAGADLTGNGAFTLDNNDLETFGGVPKPIGSINLKLVGGNALLDKLVQMGLLPEDQAMGFRMMTGMFAKPGDGDDVLVSTIEFTEDGQVLANGQRLK